MSEQTEIMARTYDLVIPGVSQALSIVRAVVSQLGSHAGIAERDANMIEVAVDEAITNIIEHAYQALSPKPSIQLQFALCAERFVIDIVDEGEPFDYESYSPPTFPEHWMKGNTRGVGIYLIRQCMDEVSYESIPDRRNRLHLVKHLS